MKLHIQGTTIHLVGTSKEFGEVIGWPEGSTKEIKEALAGFTKDSGLDLTLGRSVWTVRGTWREFSDFIGFPEAANLSEFSTAFKRLHPEVEITLRPPE